MIISTMLMLVKVFRCTAPLNLVLQKGEGSLCFSDVPTYVELTLSIKENCKWLTLEKFNELKVLRKYYHSHPQLDCEIGTCLIGKLSNQKHHCVISLKDWSKKLKRHLSNFGFGKCLTLKSFQSEESTNFLYQWRINTTLNTLWFLNNICFSRKWEIWRPDINVDWTKADWFGFKYLLFKKW